MADGTKVYRGQELDITVENGKSYLLQPARLSNAALRFAAVSGTPAT